MSSKSKTKQPKTKQPKTKQPKTKQPKTKQPKTKQPKTKQPKTKQPKKKNTKKKIESFRPKLCSPHSKNEYSCFTRVGLEKIAMAWNEKNDDKINFQTKSDKQLINAIGNKMKKQNCKYEYCWKQQPFVKEKYQRDSDLDVFKPNKPSEWKKMPRTWLNTNDINRVLKQYEKKYLDFKYFGAVPIDFDDKLSFGSCVVNELCTINLVNLHKSNINRIGIVFNIDPHYKSGQHWIAMFCDLKKEEISFWDSVAEKPPNEVVVLMNRLKDQAKELNKNMKININTNKHQYKNTECGIYSINFIVKLLEGYSFTKVSQNIIKDDQMFKNRSKYFANL